MIAERGKVLGPAAFLFLALVLGGSIQSPMFVLIVQVAAVALLGVSLATMQRDTLPTGAVLAFGFAALLLVLPLAQLVPLSASLWAALPGHAFPADILSAAGLGGVPRQLSLSPDATWRMLPTMLPPIAIFVSILTLSTEDRRALILVIVAAATASAVLGLLQTMGTAGYLYNYVHRGNSTGFFANRNHQADLMLVAALLVAGHAASVRRRPEMSLLPAAGIAIFLISAVTTTSRAGTALVPLAAVMSIYLLAGAGGARPRRSVMAAAILIAVACAALVMFSPVVQAVLARYQQGNEERRVMWQATRAAIAHFWPLGSGLGSFPTIYSSFENLDTATSLVANHAHNEYLELALETGIAGPIMIVLFVVLVGMRLAESSASPRAAALRTAGATAVILALLHSAVDYPLRMPGLATLFGFCCGLIHLPPTQVVNSPRSVSARHGGSRPLGSAAKSW